MGRSKLPEPPPKICAACGKEFTRKPDELRHNFRARKACGTTCRAEMIHIGGAELRRRKYYPSRAPQATTLTCETCGRSRDRQSARYCSQDCYRQSGHHSNSKLHKLADWYRPAERAR